VGLNKWWRERQREESREGINGEADDSVGNVFDIRLVDLRTGSVFERNLEENAPSFPYPDSGIALNSTAIYCIRNCTVSFKGLLEMLIDDKIISMFCKGQLEFGSIDSRVIREISIAFWTTYDLSSR